MYIKEIQSQIKVILKKIAIFLKKKYHLYKNKSQQFTIIRLSFCIPVT